MQYITKLAMSQSQKPRSSSPKLLYNLLFRRTSPNFSCSPNTAARRLVRMHSPCKVPVNIYLYFHLLISVCPKTIQVYMYGDGYLKTPFLHMKTRKILGMLFTFHFTPQTTTLGNEFCLKLLLGVCNTKESGDLSISL
jgi:hypothetical protein